MKICHYFLIFSGYLAISSSSANAPVKRCIFSFLAVIGRFWCKKSRVRTGFLHRICLHWFWTTIVLLNAIIIIPQPWQSVNTYIEQFLWNKLFGESNPLQNRTVHINGAIWVSVCSTNNIFRPFQRVRLSNFYQLLEYTEKANNRELSKNLASGCNFLR